MINDNSDSDIPCFRIWGADDVVYGPVELPTLIEWVQDERVEADTWIYIEHSAQWSRAAEVTELSLIFRKRAEMAEGGGGPGIGGGEHDGEPTPLVQGIKPGMLLRVKVLSEMNDQQLGRFVQFMEVLEVKQFQEVVRKGEHGDAMFMVLEGEVRVRLMSGSKETILTTLHAGDFFGDISLFDQGPRSADVVANSDGVLLKITAEKFRELTQKLPDLATPFLTGICRTMTARMRADNKRYQDAVNFARASK